MDKKSAKRLREFMREALKQNKEAYTLIITRELAIDIYKCAQQIEKSEPETEYR